MAWTTPFTATSGDIMSASQWNSNVRDNLNWLNPVTMAAFTPTWTAVSSNPAIGNGTIAGLQYAVGNLVHFRIAITMGSSTTFGTGAWYLSLPFTSAQSTGVVGEAVLLDTGTNRRLGVCALEDTGKFRIFYDADTTAGITVTTPFTWATSDSLTIAGMYVRA